jgi:hypothetical protein
MGFSVFRAIMKSMMGATAWEKTEHLNAHREKYVPDASMPVPIQPT